MKGLIVTIVTCLMFASCGDEGRSVEKNVDQVLEKVEDKAEVLADSAKEKYKDVRDRLDTSLDRNDRDDTAR